MSKVKLNLLKKKKNRNLNTYKMVLRTNQRFDNGSKQ